MARGDLKSLLAAERLVEAAGCFDGLSARLVQSAGFRAVYMSGYAVAASWGIPDAGFLGRAEMVARARMITGATTLPVIADADEGYGGSRHVAWTVRAFESAGVEAIHLEDQAFPKRPAAHAEKLLVSAEEMAAKIRAAVSARTRDNFLIIGRTDALGSLGLDAAVARANAMGESGADLVMVHAIRTSGELAEVAARVRYPLVVTAGHWRDRLWSQELLQRLGYRLVLYSSITVRAAARAMREALEGLRKTGRHEAIWEALEDPSSLDRLLEEKEDV